MKRRNNIRWLLILLVASQLLLTGFVAQWLVYQYKAGKSILVENLNRQYEESLDQVIDSLLLKKVVNPAIMISRKTAGNSAGCTVPDTVVVRDQSTVLHSFTGKLRPKTNAIVTVSTTDSQLHNHLDSQKILTTFYPREDMLIRTVQLVIAEAADADSTTRHRESLYPGRPDTVMFKTVFTDRIKDYGLRQVFNWESDSLIRKSFDNPSLIVLGSPFNSDFPAVQISRYNPYVLKKILPQLLFGVILLLLTGSAFAITFRSIKKQLIVNALRNEFVGNISHELKTPVSTVKVALEALKNYDFKRDPERTGEYLDMATAEMNRLDKLVSKVLDQSLLQESQRIINPETVNLGEMADSVLRTMKTRIDEEQASFKLICEEPDVTVEADPIYIQSVLVNLIDNSLKYAGPGAEIGIRIWQDSRRAYISVTDNGPGIPAEYRTRIFEQFFRVPADNRHNVKGYGLGLSFAHMVMKQHGGSIHFENPEPGGSRFILTFHRHAE